MWHQLSPDVGLELKDVDPEAGILVGDVQIPATDADPEQMKFYLRNSISLMDVQSNGILEIAGSVATIELCAVEEPGRQLFHDLKNDKYTTADGQLSVDGKHVLGLGRLVAMDQMRHLDSEEIARANQRKDIAFGDDYEISEGGVMLRLSDIVTMMYGSKLADPRSVDERATLMIHGRDGVSHFGRKRVFDPAYDRVGEVLKGRAVTSLGPVVGIFGGKAYRKTEGGQYEETPWRVRRGTGLVESGALGKVHRKHVILDSEGQPTPQDVKPSDLYVGFDLFRTPTSEYQKWYALPEAKKEKLHEKGSDLVEALDLKNSDVQELLFDFGRRGGPKDWRAIVISPQGVTPVGVYPEELEFWDDELISSVSMVKKYRESPDEYKDDDGFKKIVKELGDTGPEGGGRLLVIENLPSPEMLIRLYNEGVRSMIFKGLNDTNPEVGSAALNQTMQLLTEGGMQFVQFDRDDVWVFHAKQMARHNKLDALAKGSIRLMFYGSANEEMMAHEPKMIRFLEKIIKHFEFAKENLVIEDGGGPASMRVTSETASKNEVLNSANAIFAEKVDMSPSRKDKYDTYWQYPTDEIAIRQRDMTLRPTLVIIERGGIGTLREYIDTLLIEQLREKLPTKVWVIDEPEKIEAMKAMVHALCLPNEEGKRYAPAWLEEIFAYFEEEDDAADDIIETTSDLKPHYRKVIAAGMTPEQFNDAVANDAKNLKNSGMPPMHEFFAAQIRDMQDELSAKA